MGCSPHWSEQGLRAGPRMLSRLPWDQVIWKPDHGYFRSRRVQPSEVEARGVGAGTGMRGRATGSGAEWALQIGLGFPGTSRRSFPGPCSSYRSFPVTCDRRPHPSPEETRQAAHPPSCFPQIPGGHASHRSLASGLGGARKSLPGSQGEREAGETDRVLSLISTMTENSLEASGQAS